MNTHTWIDARKQQPALGQYVLAYYEGSNWRAPWDPNFKVMCLGQGSKGLYWQEFGPSLYSFETFRYWMPLPCKPPRGQP